MDLSINKTKYCYLQFDYIFWGIVISIAILTVQLRYFVTTHFGRRAKLFNKFPGAPIYPFIGNAFLIVGTSLALRTNMANYIKTYGKCCRLWNLGTPILLVADANIAAKILSPSSQIERGFSNLFFRHFLKNGLVSAKASRAVEERKILNVAFSRQSFITNFMSTFNKQSEVLVSVLEKHMKTKSKINAFPSLTKCTMDIIYQTVLEKKMDFLLEKNKRHAEAILICCEGLNNRIFKPWLYLPIIRNYFGSFLDEEQSVKLIREELREVLKEKKSAHSKQKRLHILDQIEPKNDGSNGFISILLDHSDIFSEEDSVDHLTTMIAGGSETTARAINFTLFLLALDPQCQRKAQDEADNVFSLFKRSIYMADLSKLKYVEMCLKESLRLFPVFAFIPRKATFDIKLENGLIIPQGTETLIMLYELHRDPQVYPEPDRFLPERFESSAFAKRSVYHYMPFAKGIRNCIGQRFAMVESIIMLAYILRTFDIYTDQIREELDFVQEVPAKTHPTIKLTFKKRIFH